VEIALMRTAVTSLQNDRVKLIRSLDMRKARRETGLFVAEGASILVTARENGWRPEALVALKDIETDGSPVHRDLIRWALDAGADVLDVSAAVLGKLAAKDNPQSMMGVFHQRWAEPPSALALGAGDVWLALEEVRDPGNLGTIIRTVDAVGARGVIIVGQCCDPWAHECVRATMGSIFAVPVVRMERAAFLELARGWTGDVIGTDLDATEDFRKARPREPVLLVMGSEGPGMSEEVGAACSRLVVIPMSGRLDSLNLAVATALTLYQFRGPHLSLTWMRTTDS
jgi:TrmH family RNA methyltransferase